MDYTLWSKRKFYGVMVGVLFLGMILSPKGGEAQVAGQASIVDEVVTNEVVEEVAVENRGLLNQLDALDREIFELSAEVVDAQNQSLTVAGEVFGNLDTLTIADIEAATEVIHAQTARVTAATGQIEAKRLEREELLR